MHAGRVAAVVAVAVLAGTAGCGFITGQSALTFSASPATVADGTLSDTGYEAVTVTESVVTREFSAADRTREVEVTNQLARYERQVDLGPLGSQRAGVFVTFASPEVEVATQTFNPIANLSEREILQRFESQYSGVTVGDRVGNRTVSTVGGETSLEQFEGTATLSGTQVDVSVHAAKFEHEGDYVVAVAIYPQRLNGEEDTVVRLLENLDHPGGG